VRRYFATVHFSSPDQNLGFDTLAVTGMLRLAIGGSGGDATKEERKARGESQAPPPPCASNLDCLDGTICHQGRCRR
jgi:hypothetical protein